MKKLLNTVQNKDIIEEFLQETRDRLNTGVEITFSQKASGELENLALDNDISADDIQSAIMNLTVDDYYRGVDPSPQGDYSVCAFSTVVGDDNVEIYLKYGLHLTGVQVYVFSNHPPQHVIRNPFNN